jgi:hypothetical protein
LNPTKHRSSTAFGRFAHSFLPKTRSFIMSQQKALARLAPVVILLSLATATLARPLMPLAGSISHDLVLAGDDPKGGSGGG